MKRVRHLLRSSILVIIFLGVGKLTGLIRVRLVGTAFGTGSEFDAFTAANQLPEVFFIVIAGGSLAAAFIPVYSDYLANQSDQATARLASTIMTLVVMLLGGVSALGAIFAPWLTRFILVPDFPPELQQLTADIMRVILIQTTLFGISGVLSSILNAHQHFALPALAPLALDIGYVIGLYLLVPSMGIIGLAWGTVLGGLLHILIQVPALIRYQYSYRPTVDLRLPGVNEIIRLMGPRIITLGTIQLADLFIIRLASALPSGSTSSYFYGFALMQLPETLFGTAIALVVFPTMAELYNDGQIDELKRTFAGTLSIIWSLTVPAAALLILLGEPAIAFFLQGGAFDENSTGFVYRILVVFSFRVISEATLEMVARLFYAQHNTRTPMFAYLGWLVVNITAAVPLVSQLGLVGLALASTIAFSALAAALFILNHLALGGLDLRPLAVAAGRAIAATIVMSLTVVLVRRLIQHDLTFLAAAGFISALVYLLMNLLLGGKEIPYLLQLLRSRARAAAN